MVGGGKEEDGCIWRGIEKSWERYELENIQIS
jgi:hypothetical protein